MPVLKEVPNTLKPFRFHGVDPQWSGKDTNAYANCPLCTRDSKFSIMIATGQYHCLKCGEKGNSAEFVKKLWALSYEAKTDYSELVINRGMLDSVGLMSWGICCSATTGDWLVPGYNAEGKLVNLYQWRWSHKEQANILFATPGLPHGFHGWELFDPKKKTVYICEGWADGVAWWETLSQLKHGDTGLVHTANIDASLLSDANVIAVPGCGSIGTPFERWMPLLKGKNVVFLFDNDHPRKHPVTGTDIPPVGLVATQRACRLLSESEYAQGTSMSYLAWGELGYTHHLPSGYDLRDDLRAAGDTITARGRAVEAILGKIRPAPSEWLGKASMHSHGEATVVGLGCLPCATYADLLVPWRRAVKWTDDWDRTLSVMLSVIISTMQLDDQLWIKVLGPPSCGKSTLSEALSTALDYVIAKSTVRGFFSGISDDTGEDYSLVPKMMNKTLIIKDGDPILTNPNRDQMLSEARDIYDRRTRTSYRTRDGGRNYIINCTMIWCGTGALRQLDRSELGARFLNCVMMDGIDDEQEDEIIWRVANRAARNVCIESNGDEKSLQDPDMTLAMQMTGGYVCYLRQHATALLESVDMPDDVIYLCGRLGKFTAFMRARPSLVQDETVEREAAYRLVSTTIRLARCLAAVLNKTVVNRDVMERCRRVLMDTAGGVVYNITKLLYAAEDGMATEELATILNKSNASAIHTLRFMRSIKVVLLIKPEAVEGVRSQKSRWHLTPKMRKLYEEVHSVEGA